MAVNVPVISELLIGTYTRGTRSEGIYGCRWNGAAETFEAFDLAAIADNPSFLVAAGDRVLAVNEVADYQDELQGAVSDYRLDGSALTLQHQAPTLGADPCHLAFAGGRLAVANYNGANVVVYQADGGNLAMLRELRFDASGPHPRQATSHPHGVYFHGGASNGEELWIPDLGGDVIHRVRVDSGQSLSSIALDAGSGPRHLAFSAAGNSVYVIHELDNSIARLDHQLGIRASSQAINQKVSTLPTGTDDSITAEIEVVGRCVIGSNRGHDSLVSFAVDPRSGLLSEPRYHACGGSHPRHFAVTPDANWLLVANRDSNNLCALPLGADGRPGEVAAQLACPAPVCVLIR